MLTSVSPSASSAASSSARPSEPTVGAVDDVERQPGEPDLLPPLDEDAPPAVVDVEVHGPQVVGHQGAGVLDGPGGGQVDPVDQDDDDVAAKDLRLARLDGGAFFQDDVLGPVLAVGANQRVDEEGHDHDHHPGTLGELGHGEDDDDHRGTPPRRWR